MIRSITALLLVVFALVVPGIASAKPNVTLKLSGSLVTKAADGKTTLTPLDKAPTKSGDEIQYDIVASNAGDTAAQKFVSVGPVPAGTAYVAGSAHALRSHVEFSIDGGKSWSASPMVKVRLPDGTMAMKKADPAVYTGVRFIADAPLAPHQTAAYTYEVRVK